MCSGWCSNWATQQHAQCNNENNILSFYVAFCVLQKKKKRNNCLNLVFCDSMINALFITFKGFVSDTF